MLSRVLGFVRDTIIARVRDHSVSARLAEAYPAGPHGTVFPFRRIFAVARKRE